MGQTGMTLVFTNGCFDILHRGHVEYLEKSKALGDKLVVGINSDESVRQLKPGRPINKQEDRKAVLEALRCVDEVIIFNELRPLELIKKVKPDIITKGGDYTVDQVRGDGIAKVVIIPFLNGYSSTGIINEINRVC
jgi:rfaE bifunctional protein nucleotidyltransferase chain/domain